MAVRSTSVKDYYFHPFEIAVCGYSDSGKTTLITRLIDELSSRFDIGYIKYLVKHFDIDHKGKDTYKVWKSGASIVSISDRTHSAAIRKGSFPQAQLRASLSECDFIFVEGFKGSKMPKIVLLDERKEILDLLERKEIDNVLCLVGKNSIKDKGFSHIPFFNRDHISAISGFLTKFLEEKAYEIPLYGLVLAGGSSKRMGRDKATLSYSGKPHAQVVFELLSELCEGAYISLRKDQKHISDIFKELPLIYDTFIGLGPLSGILSAMYNYPHRAWLVVACDLPFVTAKTLKILVENRNPFKMATCFWSQGGDFPEPLCAVYEPKIITKFFEGLSMGETSVANILKNCSIAGLSQPEEVNLKNVNTESEYLEVRSQIGEKKL